MSDATDIRAWAKEQGLDVNTRGPVNKEVVDRWHESHTTLDEPRDTDETTPNVTKPGFKAKFQKLKNERAARPAGPKHRRASLEFVGSFTWSVLANVVGATGVSTLVPVARCLEFQSPVAGVVVDDALKGTVIDRLLQPIARAGDKAGDFGALIGLPLVVGAIAQNPAMYPKLKPVLEELIYRWYEIAGPALQKKAEKQKLREEQMGDIKIDDLIQMLFAPVPQTAEQEPAGE